MKPPELVTVASNVMRILERRLDDEGMRLALLDIEDAAETCERVELPRTAKLYRDIAVALCGSDGRDSGRGNA